MLSMVPIKSAKAPLVILTTSPIPKGAWYFGLSSSVVLIIWLISDWETGEGLLSMPTKPVTPGVVRTVTQASSSKTIWMKT